MFSSKIVRKRALRVSTVMAFLLAITHIARVNGYWIWASDDVSGIIPEAILNSLLINLIAIIFPLAIVLIIGEDMAVDVHFSFYKPSAILILSLLSAVSLFLGTVLTIFITLQVVLGLFIIVMVILAFVGINWLIPVRIKYKIRQVWLNIQRFIWPDS